MYRDEGDKPLATIENVLIYEDSVALARGTQEMDEHAQIFMSTSMDVVYRSGVEMAQIIKVAEHTHAPYLNSKITDISYKIDATGVTMSFGARRPLIQ